MTTRSRAPRTVRVRVTRSAAGAVVATFAVVLSLLAAAPATAAPLAVDAGVSTAVSSVDAAAGPVADSGIVKTAVVGFNPENIIDDSLFYDGNAMSSAEIQSFLDSKIGGCENGKCLNVLSASISSRDAWYSAATGDLVCSALQGGTMRVSELIYRVQVACGISAKAILVTLQKEQGLTTSSAPSDWNLRAAMGASCPDTEPCDPAYSGVGPQIVQGVRQLKIYKAGRFGKQPGVNYIGYNPSASCGGTNLNIRNYATAALYNYTPYQPNAASLAAGWGLGDGCSSYGNRNFFNYYTSWFGSTAGGGNPFGNVESVQAVPGGYRVTGWSIDPDTTAPIEVHVYVGPYGYPVSANLNRPDVGAAYPGRGANHGFDATVPAAVAGKVDICFYGINVGGGTNTLFGCVNRTAMVGPPVGSLDTVKTAEGAVSVSGWAIDPDVAGAVQVRVTVDGVATTVRADAKRAGLGSSYPAYGDAHGFSATVSAAAGKRTVCATAVNVGVGSDVQLGCQTVTVAGLVDQGRPPVGSLDGVTVDGTNAVVRGWAIDPDTVKAITVKVSVNGSSQDVVASVSRPDVGAAYPAQGSDHGFEVKLALAVGTSKVCVTAVNTGAGGNTSLGCRTIVVDPPDQGRAPIGNFESLSVNGATATATGWTLDPDTSKSIAVHLYVNGAGKEYQANIARPDVAAAYPATGADHGFSVSLSLPAGNSQVCAYGINTGPGNNSFLGCRSVSVGAVDRGQAPIGFFESLTVTDSTATASGWAIDPDDPAPIAVHLYVNGAGREYIANKPRPDIGAAYPASGASHGFVEQIALGAGTSQVCAYGINSGAGSNSFLGCRSVTVASGSSGADQGRSPIGNFEALAPTTGGALMVGWALDPDTSAPIEVHAYVDGAGRAYTADKSRPDVGTAYGLGDNHGFTETVPMSAGTHRVCLYAINSVPGNNPLLGCRDVSVP